MPGHRQGHSNALVASEGRKANGLRYEMVHSKTISNGQAVTLERYILPVDYFPFAFGFTMTAGTFCSRTVLLNAGRSVRMISSSFCNCVFIFPTSSSYTA